MRRLLLIAAVLLVPAAAAAQAPVDCAHENPPKVAPEALGLARVVGAGAAGRAYFRADPDTGRPCAEPRCRTRAYLVSGDEVVTGARQGAFVCAWFKSKGRQMTDGTFGWLPASALTPLPAPSSPPPAAWAGKWVRDRDLGFETSLTIKPAAPGRLKVTGVAAFGHGPEDVKRGSVHTGEVDDTLAVRGRAAGLMLPGPGGKPQSFDPEAADFECRIGLALVGDWLAVVDNNACGGLNVSFTGLYRRER